MTNYLWSVWIMWLALIDRWPTSKNRSIWICTGVTSHGPISDDHMWCESYSSSSTTVYIADLIQYLKMTFDYVKQRQQVLNYENHFFSEYVFQPSIEVWTRGFACHESYFPTYSHRPQTLSQVFEGTRAFWTLIKSTIFL